MAAYILAGFQHMCSADRQIISEQWRLFRYPSRVYFGTRTCVPCRVGGDWQTAHAVHPYERRVQRPLVPRSADSRR